VTGVPLNCADRQGREVLTQQMRSLAQAQGYSAECKRRILRKVNILNTWKVIVKCS